MHHRLNRRDFFKKTAAAGAGLGLFSGPSRLLAGALPGEDEGDASAALGTTPVVEVSAPGVMIDGRKEDEARARAMVETGIRTLTGMEDLAGAWRCFVGPKDVVGIKPNGSPNNGTRKAVLQAVVDGVRMAGVPDENIIVWEQVERYIEYYIKRIGINREEETIRFKGCTPNLDPRNLDAKLPGYETDPVEFPWGKVRVAELVANELTAIINIPALKDHACSGVTLALKNISHAVIDIPWQCHGNCCDPHIADIVNIPSVRGKLRLHILDGLLGQADGGPGFRTWNDMFVHEKMLFSVDPVAMDSIGRDWLIAARKEKNLPPLEEAENRIPGETNGRPPKHIETAAARGLGTCDPDRIELVQVAVPAPEEEEEET